MNVLQGIRLNSQAQIADITLKGLPIEVVNNSPFCFNKRPYTQYTVYNKCYTIYTVVRTPARYKLSYKRKNRS